MSASPHGTDGHGPETDVPRSATPTTQVLRVDRLTGAVVTRRRIRDQLGARSPRHRGAR